jgi:LysM domain
MAERGLPIVDGPVACPFVAFEDDRDERATSPDHRHRCYAEAVPAPRALAHQEAYCLSSAFPVCPIFQDWARREAARARPQPAPALPGEPVVSAASVEADDSFDDLREEPFYEDRPRRNPQRGWASPPPWLSRANRAGRDDELGPDGPASGGLDEDELEPDDAERAPVGLAGSFADRLVSGGQPASDDRPEGWRAGDQWDDEIDHQPAGEPEPGDDERYEPPPVAVPPQRPVARHRERERVGAAAAAERDDRHAGDRSADRRREVAPSWERPARLEAYPTLRSRRMPEIVIPPLVVAAVAVLFAALLLFLLPGFLGVGGPQAGASPTPTGGAGASTVPASIVPTAVPAPTQQVYVVQAGDTMSKIAGKFGIPLQTLIDANKTTIPNPNQLQIGDQVTIPTTTPTALPGTSP